MSQSNEPDPELDLQIQREKAIAKLIADGDATSREEAEELLDTPPEVDEDMEGDDEDEDVSDEDEDDA